MLSPISQFTNKQAVHQGIFVKSEFGTVKAFVHGSTVFNHHCMSPPKAM